MEDFGYKKIEDKSELPGTAKRILLGCATLFSLAVFIYITISAYYFVHEDKEADIETIKSPEGLIKVVEEEPEQDGMQVDNHIYEDIFGSKQNALKQKNVKIRAHAEPALPTKIEAVKEVKNNKTATRDQEKIMVYSADKKEPTKQLLARDHDEDKYVEKRDNTAITPPKKVTGKRIIKVQIAAMSSREAAVEQWQKLNGNYSSVFSELKPYVEKVDLGKRGIFYRLQIGDFSDQISAEKFCSRYVAQTKKSSADCIMVE